MQLSEVLLMVITIALLGIWMSVSKINARTREHFPTEKEADRNRGVKDPIGHSEAHSKDTT